MIKKLSELHLTETERQALANGAILKDGIYWNAWMDRLGVMDLNDPALLVISDDELFERNAKARRDAGLRVDAPIVNRHASAVAGELIEEE